MNRLHRARGEAVEGRPRPAFAGAGRPEGEGGEPELSPAHLLGVEHDVIRRVATALGLQSGRIGETGQVDAAFMTTVVDFIVTYGGRVHHEKEEILFRTLDDKPLSPEDRQTMEELEREHLEMRRLVEQLDEAKNGHWSREDEALTEIPEAIDDLVDPYPGHKETEEGTFFPVAMDDLKAVDQQDVVKVMRSHDRAIIHETYGSVADHLEARAENWTLRG